MRYTGLKARVKRAEKRQRHRKPLPKVFSGIYPEEQPGPIVGIGSEGKVVRLRPGETIEQLQSRAMAELPGRFLQVLYAATDAPERASEPLPGPTPTDVPSAPAGPSVGDPGVGRIADLATLQRMGARPVPAERLI